jgi:hypothetical protein
MPTYEYKCGHCGHSFEIRHSMNDEPIPIVDLNLRGLSLVEVDLFLKLRVKVVSVILRARNAGKKRHAAERKPPVKLDHVTNKISLNVALLRRL